MAWEGVGYGALNGRPAPPSQTGYLPALMNSRIWSESCVSTVPIANTSATAARKRGVFRLQLANLSGELVDALTHRRESERRCFQSVGRVASGHSCWRDPREVW
jgi:hypothetical protein